MRADLHVHTNFSPDGFSSTEEVVDMALVKGLNYIAITDHNTTEGAEKAKEYAEGKGIVVIIGEEISTKEGDILAINIKREIPPGLSLHETVARIHKQGGFAIAPHPYFPGAGVKFGAFINDLDAIEGFNGSDYYILGETITKRQCKKLDMPFIASSDAHFAEDVGICGIEFDGDIFDCLVSGNFKIFGRKISLHRVLLWQTKYFIREFKKRSKIIKKFSKKRDVYGQEAKSEKRAKNRKSSREESFREA